MKKEDFKFSFDVYDSLDELNEQDAWLLSEAREVTQHAYAPYSHFKVGAIARLSNGDIVAGSKQEKESFPVGVCAGKGLFSSSASLFSKNPNDFIALNYKK